MFLFAFGLRYRKQRPTSRMACLLVRKPDMASDMFSTPRTIIQTGTGAWPRRKRKAHCGKLHVSGLDQMGKMAYNGLSRDFRLCCDGCEGQMRWRNSFPQDSDKTNLWEQKGLWSIVMINFHREKPENWQACVRCHCRRGIKTIMTPCHLCPGRSWPDTPYVVTGA